jgi:hypothetical protein
MRIIPKSDHKIRREIRDARAKDPVRQRRRTARPARK